MRKIGGKIYYYFLGVLSNIGCIDAFLLRMNDAYNYVLKALIRHSFKTRITLYGEGRKRLSNDPDIHLYYRWPVEGHLGWMEQAMFNIFALQMFEKRKVLELGCANGWYYREFYSNICNLSYTGCDLNSDTIDEAIRKCKRSKLRNASFVVADISKEMPLENENLSNVFWYASMCMFTKEQRADILLEIAKRLKNSAGILSGSCEIKSLYDDQWSYYVGLLESEEELKNELNGFFRNVFIIRSSGKNSVFFMASDGNLPFYNM